MSVKVALAILSVVVANAHAQRTCVCTATWGGGDVNLRAGPGTGFGIIATVPVSQCYDYTGSSSSQPDGTWYEIEYSITQVRKEELTWLLH